MFSKLKYTFILKLILRNLVIFTNPKIIVLGMAILINYAILSIITQAQLKLNFYCFH